MSSNKIFVHLLCLYLLIHIYVFSMYTTIIILNTNFLKFNHKQKVYSNVVTLFYFSSMQVQIFKIYLMWAFLSISRNSNKQSQIEKKIKFISILTRFLCFFFISNKILFEKNQIRFNLLNYLTILQLIIGLEYSLYLLYLYQKIIFKCKILYFANLIRLLYKISFALNIQNFNYKIPILLLIPENYFNLKFKKIIKKKILFNETFLIYLLSFYFYWILLLKFISKNKFNISKFFYKHCFFKILFFFKSLKITISFFTNISHIFF